MPRTQVTAVCSGLGETQGPEHSCRPGTPFPRLWVMALLTVLRRRRHQRADQLLANTPLGLRGSECKTVGVRTCTEPGPGLPPSPGKRSRSAVQCRQGGGRDRRREGHGKALQGQQVSGNEPPPVAASGPARPPPWPTDRFLAPSPSGLSVLLQVHRRRG